MQVKSFTFNPLGENTYIIYDETGECAIIDAGCSDREECEELSDFIKFNNLTPVLLLNTHCHIDHIAGNAFVKRTYNLDLQVPEADVFLIKAAEVMAQAYGFYTLEYCAPDKFIKEGEQIKFGNTVLEIIAAPGHSPGHLVFFNARESILIAGDVLFRGSFGRPDLPGGSLQTLYKSITQKLFILPEDTIVFCGHGPSTTIGYEKRTNPILNYGE